jgi:acyl-CoA synthetase
VQTLALRQTDPELAARYRAEGLWADQSLGSFLHRCLVRNGRRELRVWSANRPFRSSIAEVHDQALRMAGGLAERGIGPGDVVAFQLPNWPEAAAAFWGLACLGAVLVPVVHFYGPKELGFILEQSGARALITADRFGRADYLEALEGLAPSLDRLELKVVVPADPGSPAPLPPGCVAFAELAASERLSGPAALDPESPALIAYTSGTTSDPKGVVHTHLSLTAEVIQMARQWPAEKRPGLMGAPVGHAIGMLGGLLGPLYRGQAVHLAEVWHPPAILAAFLEADLVFSGGATYFLTSLLDDPSFRPEHLSHMRRAGLGGSPVPKAVADRAQKLGIEIMRSYGSTEHPSITGALYDEPADKRAGTDGHPLAGVEVKLLDEAGAPVGPGTPGQIFSRGPELFAGYTDPSLTEKAFWPGGWYATGDIGVMDEDGWLTITDRLSDIIIRGGENISAGEVEEQLLRMEGVDEAAVVAAPDARLGEHACAFLRLAPGARGPTMEEVRAHLARAGLARQKWPEELRVVQDLPRTPSSKVKKYVLRDQLRAEAAARQASLDSRPEAT